ncbi:ADP-forming succinate--CoA ligase subunit beta [Estrella lausannensis]|uniref:Succinate--CoA ligase [ADP-forming] subunit beta n=1 Tax=Estrella lausannensis TaxID=483423 RepID=A0A0H5DR50_9BACT|nr:ADP-forming succinate--CoA ligase subunit beta [Estrella lausannensis]CRX39151.1 Succinyl-CoA ligase [ADP-forming] subunit beta [Estrella lausannensis]
MNLHEFQAKEVLKRFGIHSPACHIVKSEAEAEAFLKKSGWQKAVVKAQVHAGGRGKAGGVLLAKTPEEILQFVKNMLSKKLVTKQTGSQGVPVELVMLSELIDIEEEYYASVIIDRKRAGLSLIISREGGVEIEEVAEKDPGKVMNIPISASGKIREYQKIEISKFMGWPLSNSAVVLLQQLIDAFIKEDAAMIEINPLVKTKQGEFLALDAKMALDDNALYRQKDASLYYDPSQIPEQEAEAKKHDLSYIALEGEIGCMVNGAGLAMATMDIIQHFGGKPANFLDVGGGASKEKVAEGFKIILHDPSVKAIFVNIFGGIMNCETLSLGVVEAAKEIKLKVPLVVRMEGTNVEKGKAVLRSSGLNILVLEDMESAAKKVTELAHAGKGR